MKRDVIIVGAGLAALTLALSLPKSMRVLMISKGSPEETSSDRAQGGIAAATAPQDNVSLHVKDTMVAGAGLCDADAVAEILGDAPAAIEWLVSQQVPFTRDNAKAQKDGLQDGLHLTREGGHSVRRIAHAADYTGHAIMETLRERANQQENIELLFATVIDLLITNHGAKKSCCGVKILTKEAEVKDLFADAVVLATGGMGQIYPLTSNGVGATGDGVAMAWRAGCRVSNMEFIQFHPTCLSKKGALPALISEAVRGEGGQLKRRDGSRFMPEYDEREELAPRDIVARAILNEMIRHKEDCVWLDISHQPPEMVKSHFPSIYESCLAEGIDITKQPIPVAPAAHYSCGGVLTNTTGNTDIDALLALGETACTGLHGANRLASNSLLECVVMGRRAAQYLSQRHIENTGAKQGEAEIASTTKTAQPLAVSNTTLDEQKELATLREELLQVMAHHAGILRSLPSLNIGLAKLDALKRRFERLNAPISVQQIELRNMLDVADLIFHSALLRKESRGLHMCVEWPHKAKEAVATILTPPSCTDAAAA